MCVCIHTHALECACMHAVVYTWRSESTLERTDSFLPPCGSWGLNSALLDFVASTFTYSAILLTPKCHLLIPKRTMGLGNDEQ